MTTNQLQRVGEVYLSSTHVVPWRPAPDLALLRVELARLARRARVAALISHPDFITRDAEIDRAIAAGEITEAVDADEARRRLASLRRR